MISSSPKTKRLVAVLLHVLVWTFWFAAPILFSYNRTRPDSPLHTPAFNLVFWIPMLFSLTLFYLNYLILIDKLLFNKKILWFIVSNVLLIWALSWLADLSRDILMDVSGNSRLMPKPPRDLFFKMHHFSLLFTVSISVAIRTTDRWYTTENQRKNLENENLKSELINLKMQLNPHFFFNTLNNIYSLIQSSPEKAQESVHGLAKMMRYHLYDTNAEQVPIDGEIEFMKNFISLMELRFSSNIEITTNFDIENHEISIAPLLFVPLIENAFKHGVNPLEKSIIKISLHERNHILTFESFNSNSPQKYHTNEDDESYGIGLDNIQKRLSLIYPNRFTFIKDYAEKLFHIKLVIQL